MAPRDIYANLLGETRGLLGTQSSARDAWYQALPYENKQSTLFELEMLLKGFACMGNPRNLVGPTRNTPAAAHDFRYELAVVRDAVRRCVELIRQLLGESDRAFAFSRYLESVIPQDAERSRLVKEQLTQNTPVESLFVLRNTFTAFLEMAESSLRLGRISDRLYYAILGTITREVGRNTYFNPLVSLEFRPEFDRIRTPQVLESLSKQDNEAAHRVTALAFLSLFRALRYIELVDHYAANPVLGHHAYVILAVFRSDSRALCTFLVNRSSTLLADAFESDILNVPVGELESRYDSLKAQAADLLATRDTLQHIASTLRIEIQKTCDKELPSLERAPDATKLGPQLVIATASLRASLHHAIAGLCNDLHPESAIPVLASTETSRKAASVRLRRDVWMFAQILRAFIAKARATKGNSDGWASYASFRFVKEFLSHFRAIGYQLVRMSDYERLDEFMDSLDALRDVDLMQPEMLQEAAKECEDFHHFLQDLFSSVGKRAELSDVPFNKRAAAETLKIYLGAA